MKTFRTLSVAMMLLATVFSCKKITVEPVDFTVTTDRQAYKVGDTVRFQFTGNPDNLTFYSGEPGFKYANKDRVTAKGTPTLNFTYFYRTGTQSSFINLFASTDFNGVVNAANIASATWTDITNRSTFVLDVDNSPSGNIDLSDLVVDDRPLFLAFRYVGYSGSPQRSVAIKSFNVVNNLPGEVPTSIATIANAGWLPASIAGTNNWQIQSATVFVSGYTSATANQIANTAWVVTQPLYVNRIMPDKGLPIKSMSKRLSEYTYRFATAGTYQVTFVASNRSVDGAETVLKNLTIIVE